jgi:serine/threonine protein kinase
MGDAMNSDSQKAPDQTDAPAEFPREIRCCTLCGARFSATKEHDLCPVCLLRGALDEAAPEQTGAEKSVQWEPSRAVQRFEHYEVALGEDGRPLELGRGAMGITYKAVDVDLQCPVTLKVISERYLGDETAQVRFLREARAAASVRHPNVASVFHLGRRGRDYFYAMEFVEGETLDALIKRSGPLDVKLALEITRQVASGLAAVHKKKLVHRDMKPSNIMVSLEEEGAVTAKIIDLGLAKVADESGAQTTISASGAFAGTPEFASPEQIVGGEVDIRSDLYSLGVSLWQMLTGEVPFRGSAVGVMSQHQHAAVPLEKLEGVPQPLVSLVEVLLNKDPARRFQTPTELLKALPATADAIENGSTISYTSLGQVADHRGYSAPRTASAGRKPENISIARLPVTGSDLFGREEDIAFLNDAWANPEVNVVTIVAWAGVGKSTLVNHWLRGMAAEHYRAAELVFGWSFYRQGTSGGTSSADEFVDAALTWFGDPDPRIGTAWEKGERLAKLIARRRTLLVLDGLEPLQNPPGSQEGRLREPALQALFKELAAFNAGLCVITTRLPVADIADYERTFAPRRDLEQLSSDDGAKLLRALGLKGDEPELRSASDEFSGHCLALTLLGSYLTDAHSGDINSRREVSGRLSHDVRQGVHARKVMESYQTWFGEGPELSVLRILGLFDRPADERAIEILLRPPAIPGLTERLTNLSPSDWRAILARLRRARLLMMEDPHNRGQLDAHPLVREYFGEQLRDERAVAWKECNKRLYDHYRKLARQLPENFGEMEPLFLAVICACNAGLFREALHDIYIPRIQRGNECFAVNVLGARGALLSTLIHFFEHDRWESPVETGIEGQRLTPEDQLFILMQAGIHLSVTRGFAAPEARICYERAESLCHSLDRPLVLYYAQTSQWRYSMWTDKLTATLHIAKRAYSLAQEQDDPVLLMGANRSLACPLYMLGDFRAARQHALRGVEIWRAGGLQSPVEESKAPAVTCLCVTALCHWHFREIGLSRESMADAAALAKELNYTYAIAIALNFAAHLAHFEGNCAQLERVASHLMEHSTRQNFVLWLAIGTIFCGSARSVAGDTLEGISLIDNGLRDYRATGAILNMPFWLALRAEALHRIDRTREALETIEEAQTWVETSEERWCSAELHRLRGVFLAAVGADDTQTEASFRTALSTAKQQESLSFEKRVEATHAEYCRQKASRSPGEGLRIPLR